MTCSLVSSDYLNSTNFLYHHSFDLEAAAGDDFLGEAVTGLDTKDKEYRSRESSPLAKKRKARFKVPEESAGSKEKSPRSRKETMELMRKREEAINRALRDGSFESTPCPGCGLPMHRHTLSEQMAVDNAIVEEYVRLCRRDGKGVFKGTANHRLAKNIKGFRHGIR